MGDKRLIAIDIYDDDGEAQGGLFVETDGKGLRDEMMRVLEEGGIPVIRCARRIPGKLDGESLVAEGELMDSMVLDGALEVRWDFCGASFQASGPADDVIKAQLDMLDALIEVTGNE